jgi:predicted nucleic acid-binding protein
VTRLTTLLAGVSRLGLDTAPIIYYVEAHPRYDQVVSAVFEQLAQGHILGVTSVITLAEALVLPLLRGDTQLAEAYQRLFQHAGPLRLEPIHRTMAVHAAELRARYNLRTPDALQLAAALRGGCEVFLTNDMRLKRVTDLRVLVLDELSS